MIALKTYGYTKIEAIPGELLPARITELRRERFTVVTERGEIMAVLIQARQSGGQPFVILTKADLVEDAAIKPSRAVPFSPLLLMVRYGVNGGRDLLSSSMRTSLSKTKRAISSIKGLKTNRSSCGASKRKKMGA